MPTLHRGFYAIGFVISLVFAVAVGIPEHNSEFNPFVARDRDSPPQVQEFAHDLSIAAARNSSEQDAYDVLSTRLSTVLAALKDGREADILLFPTTLPNREKLMIATDALLDSSSRERPAAAKALSRLDVLVRQQSSDWSGSPENLNESYLLLIQAHMRLEGIRAAGMLSKRIFAAKPQSISLAAETIQQEIQNQDIFLFAHNLPAEIFHEAISFFSKPGALRPAAAVARLKEHIEARERDLARITAAKDKLSAAVAAGARKLLAEGGRQEARARSRRQAVVARSAWEDQREKGLSLIKTKAGFSSEAAAGPDLMELEFGAKWKQGLARLETAGDAILAEHFVEIASDVERERLAALAMARDILNDPAGVKEFNAWELVMLLQWMGGDNSLPATSPSAPTAFDAFDLYYSGQALSGPALGYVLPREANMILGSLSVKVLQRDLKVHRSESSWAMLRPPEPHWTRSPRLSALVPEPKGFTPAFMEGKTGPSSELIRQAVVILEAAAIKSRDAASKGM